MFRLKTNFIAFLLYFGVFFMAFIYRPYSGFFTVGNKEYRYCSVTPTNKDQFEDAGDNITEILTNMTTPLAGKQSSFINNMKTYYCNHVCHLLHVHGHMDVVRLLCEILTVIGVGAYMISTIVLIRRLGWKHWYRTLLIFNLSFLLVMVMIPLRLSCLDNIEHVVGILAMVTTSFHFLFFCRGMKFIGPSVLMVYKILSGDMIRFFLIYVIFVIGFSQSFFIIFLGCYRGISENKPENGTRIARLSQVRPDNILTDPAEAFLRMFIMSLGEFSVFYKNMNLCRQHIIGKVLFMIFELGVSIMLLNLLIAMMARTYQEIAETEKEWKRQWAKVILMLEESLKPSERLLALLKYSRPIGTDKRKRAFVVKYHQSAEEAEIDRKTKEKEWQEFMEEKRALYKRRLHGDLSLSRSVSRVDGLMTRLENGNLLPNMLNHFSKSQND